MNWFRKLSLEEIISGLGLLLSVTGQAFLLAGLGAWSNYMRVFGLALFLVGLILLLHKIQDAIEKQRGDHDVLDTMRSLAEINAWQRRKPQGLYVRATGEVLQHIVSDYVPTISAGVNKFRNKENNEDLEIVIRDHSPIVDLMHRIGEELPRGSVWLGITRLESKATWVEPLDDFLAFRNMMRRRAKSARLRVFRLYSFERQDSLQALLPELREEVNSGIAVRALVGAKSPPPDISLLWIPRGRRHATGRPARIDDDNPLAVIQSDQYEPLCAMIYDTRAGALLTRLVLAPGTSRIFEQMADVFEQSWTNAHPISASPAAAATAG